MTLAKQLQKYVDELNKYSLEIGVFSGKTKRKYSAKVGLTNAEILFINEHGSPLRHIPARPVLKLTINYARQQLIPKAIGKCLNLLINNNIVECEKELDKLAIRIESYARQLIYKNDGTLAPNAPSVAAKKGGNHPLFNTGQLARSITCRVVKV